MRGFEFRHRYELDKIYTNMVNILIAINPYKSVPIYGPEFISKYQGVNQHLFHKLPPHVYAVAEAAYTNLIGKGENQVCFFSFFFFFFFFFGLFFLFFFWLIFFFFFFVE